MADTHPSTTPHGNRPPSSNSESQNSRFPRLKLFCKMYKIGGPLMYIFGNSNIFELVMHVVTSPGCLEVFRRYQGKNCAMAVLAGTIVALVAITSLLLPNVNQVHWMTRALWFVSGISAFTSVLFSCTRQKIIGRLWCPNTLKGLYHEKKDEFPYHEKKDKSPSASPDVKKFPIPEFAVVMTFSLNTWFLHAAIWTYVIGLGVYLGAMWRNSLDGDGEYFDDRNIFIIFLVYTIICVCSYFLVYALLSCQQKEDRKCRWNEFLKHYDINTRPDGICINEILTEEQGTSIKDLEKN